jgi:hypothetical protein
MKSCWCLWSIPFHKRFRNRPQNLRCNLTVPNVVSNSLSAFLRVIHLMVLAIHLSVVLHAGSRVIFHCFLNLRLCFSKFSRLGISLLRSKSVFLLVDSLYAEAIEAVKLRATLSVSSPQVILDTRSN